jgi:MoxR-like ATPase
VQKPKDYIRLETMGEAFKLGNCILLIDEIDKADIEFPNDLLHELDRMEFTIPETGEVIKAQIRPLVIITSNNEKELPDAFLRRCVFHFIQFPEKSFMEKIVRAHHPQIEKSLLDMALESFYILREKDLKKKTSVLKELKFSPDIAENDLLIKSKKAIEFLNEGNKVRVTVQFKGRGIVFKDRGTIVLLKLAELAQEAGIPDSMPELNGKRMSFTLKPKK